METQTGSREGSTTQLIQLCLGYYLAYVVTGVTVKYFLGSASKGFPGMQGLEFLVYSTLGGSFICLGVVLWRRWYRFVPSKRVQWGRWAIPLELLYIIPSGVCTAVIIPTTTLMYTLPISVMVAMVIMRAAVIVISRLVDAVQIRQGILKKRVYPVENLAVGFALLAVATRIFWTPAMSARLAGWGLGQTPAPVSPGKGGDFDFLQSSAAMMILGSYVVAYAIRIYIMNYYKNTRPRGVAQNNKAFFGIEQLTASVTLSAVALAVYWSPWIGGAELPQMHTLRSAMVEPLAGWHWAALAGMAFGVAAFFSVFLFMFKGRTATFSGLVNRLTSLVAGTTATLAFAMLFGGSFPKSRDWISLAFILFAVALLAVAEWQRAAEGKPMDSQAPVGGKEPVVARSLAS